MSEGVVQVHGWQANCRCGWRGSVWDQAVQAEEEACAHNCSLILSLEEATAIVSAAYCEDHDARTYGMVLKRLGDAVDASLGLSGGSDRG